MDVGIKKRIHDINFILKSKFYGSYMNDDWILIENKDFSVFKPLKAKYWDYVLVGGEYFYYIRAMYICSFWWTSAYMFKWKVQYSNGISYIDKRWFIKRLFHYITWRIHD